MRIDLARIEGQLEVIDAVLDHCDPCNTLLGLLVGEGRAAQEQQVQLREELLRSTNASVKMSGLLRNIQSWIHHLFVTAFCRES